MDPYAAQSAQRGNNRNRESGPLVDLFAEDASPSKIGMPHTGCGKEGARDFWERYRDVFDAVEATFQHVASDDTAFLEWTSEGTLKDIVSGFDRSIANRTRDRGPSLRSAAYTTRVAAGSSTSAPPQQH